MTQLPRLCAIDVDGTLVNPEKSITEVNKKAIDAYMAAGGKVVIASGRMHSSIYPFAAQLELTDDNIILSYNGGMAKTLEGTLLFERPVPATLAIEIVDYCRDHSLHLNYYLDDQLYVTALDKWSKLYSDRTGSVSNAVGDLAQFAGTTPTKLLIINNKEAIDHLLGILKKRYGGLLHVTKTDDEYLEFMGLDVNKATGLSSVAEKLAIPRSSTCAFGDSYNDVEMIEWAHIGVAMSNGRVAARAAADIVADNSEYTGVGETLNKFLENVN